MAEGDVTINLPKLYRGVADRLKHEKTAPGYDEGWNDALYLVLDILDGQEPISAHIDGLEGESRPCPDCEGAGEILREDGPGSCERCAGSGTYYPPLNDGSKS